MCETITSRYETTLGLSNGKNKNIELKKIAVVIDNIEYGIDIVKKSRLQLALIAREKLEYYCLYSFIIEPVAIDRALIDIIDISAETPLFSSCWVAVKICNKDASILLALPDQLTQIRYMKMVNVHRLHKTSNRDLVKLIIKWRLDTTDFESLDTLLNQNLLCEAGIYVCDIL